MDGFPLKDDGFLRFPPLALPSFRLLSSKVLIPSTEASLTRIDPLVYRLHAELLPLQLGWWMLHEPSGDTLGAPALGEAIGDIRAEHVIMIEFPVIGDSRTLIGETLGDHRNVSLSAHDVPSDLPPDDGGITLQLRSNGPLAPLHAQGIFDVLPLSEG